jgi:inner membrane transporter RhtA
MVRAVLATDHVDMRRRPRPELYLVGSALFHYLGPSFAVLLFARVHVLGVAWLRIASAALVFLLWRRPWRLLSGLTAGAWRLLLAWGAVLAAMNCCFYEAIDRLALGTVAAIEFLAVIGLAALGARTRRNVLALLLAVAGVYLLSDVRLEARLLGLAFAFANALLFGLYIMLGHRVSRHGAFTGIDGLAIAMVIAAVIVTPIGAPIAARALGDPIALLASAGVGICSSVVPYVLDQLAMARLARATYSLMLSLLPAVATVVGLVVLGQVPSPGDVVGVTLVVVGVAVHREAAARAGDPRHRHGPELGESRYAAGASTGSGAVAGAAGSSGGGAGAG